MPETPRHTPDEEAAEATAKVPATGEAADAADAGQDDSDGGVVCAVCGRQRPSGSACGCGQQPAARSLPEDWDAHVTRTSRPRLPLTGRG